MQRNGPFAYRGLWTALSIGVHMAIFATIAWLFFAVDESVTEPKPEPIPVTLLRPPEPAPERELSQEILHFRKPTHPRVRETIALPREVLALAPPPLDVALEQAASSGGHALTLAPHEGRASFSVGGAGGGLAGTGVGSGNGRASGGGFQEYVGGLRQIGLDVVFVVDATGSMGWLIAEVKGQVRELAEWIRELVPVTRFGVVAYRDDDDPEFLVRVRPLTLNISKIYRFLDELEARGGGDLPEGVEAGLRAATERAGWSRDAKRLIVIVGDAPPHPGRLESTLALARAFREEGGSVSTVDVSFDANPEIAARRLGKRVDELQTLDDRGVMREFRMLAEAGGGDGSTLEGETQVVRQLAVLIFGKRWAEAVRPLLGDL